MRVFTGLVALFVCCASATQAVAGLVVFRWTDTVNALSSIPGATTGDPFFVDVTVDNGGMSLISQMWTGADFVSLDGNVNNGAFTFQALSMDGFTGSFATDGAGNLIAVPTLWWNDGSTTNSLGDSAGYIVFNGFNPLYADSSTIQDLQATNVAGNLVAANWSPVAIPEPSAFTLLGLAALGGIGYGWRRKRQAKTAKRSSRE